MNILTTFCKPVSDTEFQVFWRNGAKKQGLLNIKVEAPVDDREIIAELSALQWLLGHRSVLGETQVGKGLRLTITFGAVRKLAKASEKFNGSLEKSELSKPHLFPYARFIGHRFAGLEVVVDKDESWIMPRAQNDVEELVITEPLPEVLHIPSIGLVQITTHAILQFGMRLAAGSPEDTWRLLRSVTSGRLRMAKLGEAYDRRQAEKYGESGQIWVNDELKWALVVCSGNPIPVVTTAYAVKKSAVADRV